MTTATPRERVLRALDALLPYLEVFVNQALDASPYEGKRVAADIGPLAHAIREEWRGVFSARLDGRTRNYVHELLDIRNRLAHSKPFDDEDARRACDTIRLVAKAIGAPLDEFDRRAASGADRGRWGERNETGPAVEDPAPTPRRASPASRRPTQRAVMRDIWGRTAPDEERTIREYADAERRGEAPRKQNRSGQTPEEYARALLADGLRKGWLDQTSGDPSEVR